METCPTCQHNEFKIKSRNFRYRFDNVKILVCQQCGLGITSPEPADFFVEQEASLQFDSSSINWEYEESQLRHWGEVSKQQSKPIFSWLAKKTWTSQPKFLEIGCGVGLTLNIAREVGFEVTGFEVTEKDKHVAKHFFNFDLKHADVNKTWTDIEEGAFDVILASHVFEHLKDPTNFFNSVKKHLKPNGQLLLMVPNFSSLRLAFSKPKNYSFEKHFYFFTQKSLKIQIEKNGFNVIHLKSRPLVNRDFRMKQFLLTAADMLRDTEQQLFSVSAPCSR